MAALTTDFSKAVRHWLIDNDKSTAWLCEEITKRSGLYCDSGYISKIYRGERPASNICKTICEITGLEM